MSDYIPALDDQTPEVVITPASLPFWRRLATLEPALIRQFGNLLLMVATFAGFAIGDQIEAGVAIFIAFVAFVAAVLTWLSTRSVVTPTAIVAAQVEVDGQTVAGPASTVETGELVTTTPVEPWAFEKVDNSEPDPFQITED